MPYASLVLTQEFTARWKFIVDNVKDFTIDISYKARKNYRVGTVLDISERNRIAAS
jgi:hypothetical protein